MENNLTKKDSIMFRKTKELTNLLGDVDCLSGTLVKEMMSFHRFLLGESIPCDPPKEGRPIPEGMLDYWIGELQGIFPRLMIIEEHFKNLGHITK